MSLKDALTREQLAHRFSNLIAGIHALAELHGEAVSDPTLKADLNTIRVNSLEASAVVKKLLEMTATAPSNVKHTKGKAS